MPHRVAPQAEGDLDEIWLYVARESGSMVATRLINLITERFFFLATKGARVRALISQLDYRERASDHGCTCARC